MVARGDQYYQAIQNPRLVFNDPDLKVCTPEADPRGLPVPYSGGFTTTYHLKNHDRHWAARCFTTEIPDLEKRYRAIGRFLAQNPADFLVKADYLRKGIRVAGHWYPIVKMEWVSGVPLNIFIEKNLSQRDRLDGLALEFLTMVRSLEGLKIAHGDLQHGNIIVKNGGMYLVDYDGMFLPELSGLGANDLGHVNYQHPARAEEDFDATIDRFSSIVIYLGLRAVSLEPRLWRTYDNSENLLFRSEDFRDVDRSELMAELGSLPELSVLVRRFRDLCRLDLDAMPTLDQFIEGEIRQEAVAPVARAYRRRRQYPLIDATDVGALRRSIGSKVEVIGRITDFHRGRTRYGGRPYVFLNFGSYPKQTLTLVLWSPALQAFQSADTDPLTYVGKHVRTVGVLGQYRRRPQIEISQPSQIRIAPEEDAEDRRGAEPPASRSHDVDGGKAGPGQVEEDSQDILDELYGDTVHDPSSGRPRAKHGDLDRDGVSVLNDLYGSGSAGGPPSAPSGLRSEAPAVSTADDGRVGSVVFLIVVATALSLLAVGGLLSFLRMAEPAQRTITPEPTRAVTETATSTAEPSATVAPSPEPSPSRRPAAVPLATADVSQCALGAIFQADLTIPDGVEIEAGEIFTKTWLVRNTGSCEWARGFRLHFVDGDQMTEATSVPVPQALAGQDAAISVVLRAPEQPGRYRGQYQMCVNGTECFGDRVFVEIVVRP